MYADTDYIVFGSSSGVETFFRNDSRLAENTAVVCIGKQTAKTAKKYTSNRIITALRHSAEGVADAIKGDRE
jgi:uroporphyrinogen-III synthase